MSTLWRAFCEVGLQALAYSTVAALIVAAGRWLDRQEARR